MWRIAPLLLLPVAMLAQPVPKSMLAIEMDPAHHVLQVRNHYNSDAISIVVAHSNGNRYNSWKSWDAALNVNAGPLAPGAARDITQGPPDWENWDILAVVYADGNFAGSRAVVQSILQNHTLIATELELAIRILNTEPDSSAAIEKWSEELRNSGTRRRVSPQTFGIIPLPPLMVENRVPNYIKKQLENGVSRPDIVAALISWQQRIKTYQSAVVYL